jgi:THUMP domain-like/Methyltransferase domain
MQNLRQAAQGLEPEQGTSRIRSDGRVARVGGSGPGDGAWTDVDPATLDALLTPEGRALVASMEPYDPASALAALEVARRDPRWADRAQVVAAAATQARLRTRAAVRFPGPPRWWTPDGLEQATRPSVAARHARRFTDAGVTRVLDLGCGAGSDALAMADAGLRVVAVDRDPTALWALGATAADHGLSVDLVRADVREWFAHRSATAGHAGDEGCFVDPARRAAGRRFRDPEQWSPPWSWVRAAADRVPATGAKVAPGIDHRLVPREAQVEWVSMAGDLLEAAVWWGPLRRGRAHRVACTLTGPGRAGGSARPIEECLDDADGVPDPQVGDVGAWLVEPDAAVIRSGLVSVLGERLGGRLLDPHIAYITTDDPPAASGLGTAYAVLAEVPFARKAMRAWLRARGFGDVVVKKRGVNVVPEEVRAALRLGGDGPTATLVLTRTGTGPRALLVAPRPDPLR